MESADYKGMALAGLKNHWGVAVAAGLIIRLLSNDSKTSILSFLPRIITSIISSNRNQGFPLIIEQLVQYWGLLAIITVIMLGKSFIGSGIKFGAKVFYMDLVKLNIYPDVTTLFSKFKYIFEAWAMYLLMDLLSILGYCLFIVPGIIVSLMYSMAPYFKLQDPDLTVIEAMRKSREEMSGLKMELFTTYLGFIGWFILCAFSCGIGYLFLKPYIGATEAAFFLYNFTPDFRHEE